MEIKLGKSADDAPESEEDFGEDATNEAAETLAAALEAKDAAAIVRSLKLILDLMKD